VLLVLAVFNAGDLLHDGFDRRQGISRAIANDCLAIRHSIST